MPSAASYTSRLRFAASVKNTKTQYPGGVGNLTQGSIAGCGLNIQYNPVDYVELCACNVVPAPPIPPTPPQPGWIISAFAGTGFAGYSGDGGPAINAQLRNTFGLALDSSQNLYITDPDNYRIRKIDVSTGIITTVTGNGTVGDSGDGGLATDAQLSTPSDVAVDSSGNMYITDTGNSSIRKVDTSGIITLLASGISLPSAITCDSTGNLYIAETGNLRLIRLDTTGTISVLASGPEFVDVRGLAWDSSGYLYIADNGGNVIRKLDIATGTVIVFAGTGTQGYSGDGGLATDAQLSLPSDVALDSSGNVYIADTENNCIRKVDTSGIITTLVDVPAISGLVVDSNNNIYTATNGSSKEVNKAYLSQVPAPPPPPAPSLPLVISTLTYIPLPDIYGVSRSYNGYIYTSVPSLSAIRKVDVDTGTTTILNAGYLDYPQGLEVDSVGNLYIADSGSNLIRRVNLNTGEIATLDVGVLDSPRGVTVDSVGNLYVADTGNNRIKKLNVNTGTVTILPTESLSSPKSVAVDSVGNVYIADTGNNRIQKLDVNTGIATILAAGSLDNPNDIAVDSSGTLYISDSGNNRIQQFDLNTGTITTTAGTGDNGLNVGVALASNAELGPTNISADVSGDIYVADVDNRHIRRVYVPQALPPSPPPPAVLPVLTQAQIFALTPIIVGIRNLEGTSNSTIISYLQDFKNIAGFDYFPEYTLPPYALLTPTQIFALTPIVNGIKSGEAVGLFVGSVNNEAFLIALQNFNTLAGFNYFTGYTLPPYPTIPLDQHGPLRAIVLTLNLITKTTGIVLSTNATYNSYLNQFRTITGYDYYYSFKLPTRLRLDPIMPEQLQMDTALNVILPPYDGTPYQFMTNNEPIDPYDNPVHGVIPTTVDMTNTPSTISQSTPIIKTLKLLPSNINTFEIKARGDFLYVLGTTSGAFTPDSIYKINIVTGIVQTFPLNQPANTNVVSFAMDSSDNFYYALKEEAGLPEYGAMRFTIYKKLVGTNTLIHIAGTSQPRGFLFPDPAPAPGIISDAYNGDNIPATTAQISFGIYQYHVTNLEFYNNNLFFIDFHSQRIRKIDLATNIISTVVGPTTYPIKSYAISSQGDIWFIAKVDQPDQTSALQANIFVYSQSTQQTTIFGTVSGTYEIGLYVNNLKVVLDNDIALDNNNGLYISSPASHLVYKVNIQTKKWAIIAGNPNKRSMYGGIVRNGYNGDNENPTNINTLAQLSEPHRIAVDDYGSLYIASMKRSAIPIDDFGIPNRDTPNNRSQSAPRVVRKVYNARQFVVG